MSADRRSFLTTLVWLLVVCLVSLTIVTALVFDSLWPLVIVPAAAVAFVVSLACLNGPGGSDAD
jgi:hypothetical protein